MGFIFGGNTGTSYSQIQKQREIAEALRARSLQTPRNVGEGISAIGHAIAARVLKGRNERADEARNKESAALMAALLGGGAMPPAGAPTGGASTGPAAGGSAGGAPTAKGGTFFDLLARTEGGGKYDTLFGFANRPGGKFAGVDITKMTLGELAKFTDPNGPYGQWVKEKVGRVATPLGAGQIVGTTLRNAAKALGLPDDTVFTPEIQNKLIGYLAKQRLAGAKTPEEKRAAMRAEWAGFGKVSDKELDAAIAEIEGGGGIPGAPAAGGATPPAGASPTGGAGSARIAQLLAAAADPRLSPEQRQIVHTLLAAEMAKNKAPDPIAAERLALERQRLAETKRMNDAKLSGEYDPSTKVNVGGSETALRKELGKKAGETWAGFFDDGMKARTDLATIGELESLLAGGDIGGTADAWAAMLKERFNINLGGGGKVEALTAIISRLVPAMRPPGSGTMSDRDLDLFKSSLPRLINTPEGNQMILETMRGIAEHRMRLGDISARLINGEIDLKTANNEARALPDPLAMFRERREKAAKEGAAVEKPATERPAAEAPAAAKAAAAPDKAPDVPPYFMEFARKENPNMTDDQIRNAWGRAWADQAVRDSYAEKMGAKPAAGASGQSIPVNALPGPIPPAFAMFMQNKTGRPMTEEEAAAAWSQLTPEQRDFWSSQRKENGGFR